MFDLSINLGLLLANMGFLNSDVGAGLGTNQHQEYENIFICKEVKPYSSIVNYLGTVLY